MDRAGYVLLGGRSSRMGRDKALLPFRDQILSDTVACAVEQAVGSVGLAGRGDFGSWRPIADLYRRQGPLNAQWNMIVARDMPELTATFLGAQFETAFRPGVRKITAALESGRVVRLPIAEIRALQNVNTPEDWFGYAAE